MGCDNLSEKQLTYKPPPPPTPFLKVRCQSFLSSFFESEVKLSLIKPWLFLFLVVRSKSFWGGGDFIVKDQEMLLLQWMRNNMYTCFFDH